MNALEKLRGELGVCGCDPDECLVCEVPRKVREGLQAVDRDYLPLPVDRNGEVLRIGDEVWFHDETDVDPHIVRGYGMTNGHDVDVYINHADDGWCPNTVTVPDMLVRRRPTTIEDLLDELQASTVETFGKMAMGHIDRETLFTEYADAVNACAERIRELTGGAR